MRTLLVLLLVCSAACRDIQSAAGPGLVAEGTLELFVQPDSGTKADERDYRFALPVEIHGHTFQFIADHGAQTMITDATVDAAHLPHQFAAATRADTLVGRARARHSSANATIARGDSVFEYWGDFGKPWTIDSLRIGRSRQDTVMVMGEAAAASLRPFGGLIGRDILSQFDLDVDVAARSLRLYSRAEQTIDQNPPWLPRGMTAVDCVRAPVVEHFGMDSASMDSVDLTETKFNPGRRMWNEEELMLPLTVNGRSIDGHFDSGGGETIMNWAAARELGLTRQSASVTAAPSGTYLLFSFHPIARATALDSANYRAAGITFQLGGRTLPRDTVVISDVTFTDFPDFKTKPQILVGLRHFRENTLFLSYSTSRICVGGGPAKADR